MRGESGRGAKHVGSGLLSLLGLLGGGVVSACTSVDPAGVEHSLYVGVVTG